MTYHDKDVGLQALREQKNEKAKEIRNLLDQNTSTEAFAAVRDKVQALTADAEVLDERIQAWEKTLKLESSSDLSAAKDHADRTGLSVDESNHKLSAARRAFVNALRYGDNGLTDEERELVSATSPANAGRTKGLAIKNIAEGTNSAGGYLVPTIVMPQLLTRLKAFGGMRDFARVLTTENGDPLSWGTLDDTSSEGELMAEGAVSTDDDLSFGVVTIGAYMIGSKTVPVSLQILQDAAVNVEAEVLDALAIRIARGQNRYCTTGTGSSQPQGCVVGAASGKVGLTGQTTSVIYDDLVDLEHSVDPAYRALPSCKWMFNDNTLKALKKLKDGNGRPLWLPGLASSIETKGDPDRIGRYPYVINQHMADMAANAKSIIFGAGEKYLIRDVMSTLIFRFTDSAYAKKLQVGFMAVARFDGRFIDQASSGAIKYYQNSAT